MDSTVFAAPKVLRLTPDQAEYLSQARATAAKVRGDIELLEQIAKAHETGVGQLMRAIGADGSAKWRMGRDAQGDFLLEVQQGELNV